jgi:signal transduction histidine kinase
VGRSPTSDFTVLLSLVGGLLLWLVLASYSLGRAQQKAGLRLQREVALYVAATAGPTSESAPARSALQRLLDSTGLALEPVPAAGGEVLSAGLPLAEVASTGARQTVVRRSDTPGLPMAPGMSQALQLFVSVGLAVTCILGAWVLLRLQREHLSTTQRSNFVRVVSHELRTPLAQILLFAETLRLGRTRNEAERDLAIRAIDQEARRLSRLVENVLRFTRIEHGTHTLSLETVDVPCVVSEVATQFAPLVSGVRIETQLPGTPARALADADALRQVLLNLLDNAVKYGPRSQVVRVAVHVAVSQVEVYVDDEGPGVADADRERVWHAFERGPQRATDDAAMRRPDAGTGLGLTIVRTLVEGMDGHVACTARPDGAPGARFQVTLRSADVRPVASAA